MMMILSRKEVSSSIICGTTCGGIAAIVMLILLDLSHTSDAAFVIKSSSNIRQSVGVIECVAAANHHRHMFTTEKTGWGGTTATTTATTTARARDSMSSQLNLGPAEAWSAYNEALEASPLLVKSVTASVILGAADIAGQSLEKIRKNQAAVGAGVVVDGKAEDQQGIIIDWPRAIRFAIFGLVLQAPWNHFYYMALDGQIPPTTEPFTPTNGMKVLIDQFIQAPVFTVLIFVFLGLLEGKSTQTIENQLRNDYKETLLANWKLWVPATVINIGFVPPLFRVLYLNCVFFFWSIYLSLVLNKNEEPEA